MARLKCRKGPFADLANGLFAKRSLPPNDEVPCVAILTGKYGHKIKYAPFGRSGKSKWLPYSN